MQPLFGVHAQVSCLSFFRWKWSGVFVRTVTKKTLRHVCLCLSVRDWGLSLEEQSAVYMVDNKVDWCCDLMEKLWQFWWDFFFTGFLGKEHTTLVMTRFATILAWSTRNKASRIKTKVAIIMQITFPFDTMPLQSTFTTVGNKQSTKESPQLPMQWNPDKYQITCTKIHE